jgi:ribosome-interacting GTPase 1
MIKSRFNMPANLPPQYFETEKKLKAAKTPQEKMEILEELLSIVPKHKGTEKLQALLKTKIAKLKHQSSKKLAVARHGPTFYIEKGGAGQIVLLGLPNSGKSKLIGSMTNAKPEVGEYPFTTHSPSPAMMAYENIQIQLIDTPPITADSMETWHAEMLKVADGILLVLDLSSPSLSDDYQTIVRKLKEKKIEMCPPPIPFADGEFLFRKKTLIAGNKMDDPAAAENLEFFRDEVSPTCPFVPVSAKDSFQLEQLRREIFELLEILRVYSKIPGKKVDRKEPFVFKKGNTLMDMAKAVHKDFASKLRFARIWNSDKYQGQKVNRDYELQDEDIIELHI